MNQTEALNLLLKMLAIPTVNGDFQEENLANFICEVFHNFGVNSKIEPISAGVANVTAEISGSDSGHVIAVNGHLDTVPFGDISKWNTDPSVPHIQNGCVFARIIALNPQPLIVRNIFCQTLLSKNHLLFS